MAASAASKCCFVFGVVLALLVLTLVCLAHYIAWYKEEWSQGFLEQPQSFYWSRYDDCLTESVWVLYTGMAVFLAQFVWLFYALSLSCRGNKHVNMFSSPPVVSPVLFYMFILILAGSVGWLFLWIREDYVKYAGVLMLCLAILSYALLTTSVHRLQKHYKTLLAAGYGHDVWLVRLLVHNAIGALATYTSMLVFYNIAAIIIQETGIDLMTTCYVHLGLTALFTIVFFAIDILTCAITRWTYVLPYGVLLALQGSVIQKNADAAGTENNMILIVTGILLGMTATMMIFRMMMSIWRTKIFELLEKQANMTLRRQARPEAGLPEVPGESILKKKERIRTRSDGATTVDVIDW